MANREIREGEARPAIQEQKSSTARELDSISIKGRDKAERERERKGVRGIFS